MATSARRRSIGLLGFLLAFSVPSLCGPRNAPAADPQPSAEDGSGDADAGEQETILGGDSTDREELNLLGETDAAGGESRRNENVQINLIDNNVLKELNQRVGVTATVVETFEPEQGYFGTVYGGAPDSGPHAEPTGISGFHGRLYYGHNNSVFSARSFFQVGPVAPARENAYGFDVGFRAWPGAALTLRGEQQRIRGNVNGNVLVLRSDERTPLTEDPAARDFVEQLLSAYPDALPNRPDIDPRALNTNAPQLIDDDRVGAQLDQRLGAQDSLLLRYDFTSQSLEAFQLVAGQNPDTETKSHDARISWLRADGPSVLRLTAAFQRVGSLLTADQAWSGPLISAGSALTRLGPGSSIPIDRAQNDFRYAGQWRRSRGSHEWTLGGEWTRGQVNGFESNLHSGLFSFRNNFGANAITNLRLGRPTMYSQSVGNVHRGYRTQAATLYAGDRWAARANLTLSYGVRFSAVTAPSEVDGLHDPPYDCNCANVSPRFGFAQRLPRRWGVLRGAYGLHYGEIFPVTFGQSRFNPPLSRRLQVQSPSMTNPLGNLDPADLDERTPAILFQLSDDLAIPYTHNYNFSWELEPVRGWSLSLGYVGARSHKLLMTWPQNRAEPVPGIEQTTATVNQRRPDPTALEIKRILNGSSAYFDAAKATLRIPQWRGLSVESSYWFSKAIDLGGNYTTTGSELGVAGAEPQWQYQAHRDLKSLSNFDQPHAVLTRVVYQTPRLRAAPRWLQRAAGDWELSAVVLLKSGTPFTVSTGSDSPGFGNADGSTSDRPNLADVSILGRSIDDPDTSVERLPHSAFTFIAPNERAGNLGRNTFRKDGIRNVNAAIARRWPLHADASLLLRAESINLFNIPQFAEPGTALADPNFAKITNTLNDGRTFRFHLEVTF